MRVKLEEPFYVGIGVCAHDKDATETAVFSKVDLVTGAQRSRPAAVALQHARDDHRILHRSPRGPRLSRTRRSAQLDPRRRVAAIQRQRTAAEDRGGRRRRAADRHGFRHPPQQRPRHFARRNACSPSAINRRSERQSLIYTVPIEGGTPTRITQGSPSYWHGWSPDGKTLAFVGERNGNLDIYTIPVDGGEETRLTTAEGLDDGPEYSPDGQVHLLQFRSQRHACRSGACGPMGQRQEQVTSDEYNNWFPHISPDGQRMVFLTYEQGRHRASGKQGRDAARDDARRTSTSRVLAKLFGGQGTINVPSWSPDSKRIWRSSATS